MVVWNFPMKLMIAVNDIIMAKTQLQQTISKLMLDRRYTAIQKKNEDRKGGRDTSASKRNSANSMRKRSMKSDHTSLMRYHTLKTTMLLPPDMMSTVTGSSVRSDSNMTATTFYKHKLIPSEFNYSYFDEEEDIHVWNALNCVDAFQTINKAMSL